MGVTGILHLDLASHRGFWLFHCHCLDPSFHLYQHGVLFSLNWGGDACLAGFTSSGENQEKGCESGL